MIIKNLSLLVDLLGLQVRKKDKNLRAVVSEEDTLLSCYWMTAEKHSLITS
jgi:hypothetical protein